MNGKVISINISQHKGTSNLPVPEVDLIENFGIKGYAHANSNRHRQVSILSVKRIEKMKEKGFILILEILPKT